MLSKVSTPWGWKNHLESSSRILQRGMSAQVHIKRGSDVFRFTGAECNFRFEFTCPEDWATGIGNDIACSRKSRVTKV